MKERLKELRKALDLTQQKFAERIGVKQNTVAQYEMGRNTPIDSVITLICREFNVNKEWLINGEGEMFENLTINEEIAAFAGSLMKESDDEFKKRLVEVLAKMTPEQWKVLEEIANGLIKKS